MIQTQRDDACGVLEVTASGKLHADDYNQLVDDFDSFVQEHERVAVLFVMRDFHGWDLGAAWEDCKLWVHHFGDFRRIALVGDHAWQRVMADLCRVLTTAPVKYYQLDHLEDAREWIRGPASSAVALELDESTGIAHVRLTGKLDSVEFDRITPLIDAFVERHGRIRICLDMHEFDGWDSLGALRDHLVFIFKHKRFVSRIAFVGDRRFLRAAAAVVGSLGHAEIQSFATDHAEQANTWLEKK